MRRFSLILNAHCNVDSQIADSLTGETASEPARLGANGKLRLLLEDAELSVRARYAPMHRLLATDDELFLRNQGLQAAAKQLRRQHRRCFFQYVTRLTREIRTARRLRVLAMASTERWSFWTLLAHTVLAESSLLYLRWLGCKHALGTGVEPRDVKACLDFLITGPQFRPAMT